jgi:hypothetical protein
MYRKLLHEDSPATLQASIAQLNTLEAFFNGRFAHSAEQSLLNAIKRNINSIRKLLKINLLNQQDNKRQ